MNSKNGLLILALAGGIIGIAYSLHLRKQLERTRLDLSNEKLLRQHYIHIDRYNALKTTYDSLNNVVQSLSPDTVYINQIRYKYDTVTIEVTKKTHTKQIEWVIKELDALY